MPMPASLDELIAAKQIPWWILPASGAQRALRCGRACDRAEERCSMFGQRIDSSGLVTPPRRAANNTVKQAVELELSWNRMMP
jgi:hypothetical protein